jgi:hypothetical protein
MSHAPITRCKRSWCPRKDLNLQPPVCRTSAPSLSYSGITWWSELESNQPFGFFRPALIHLSYPTVFWNSWQDSNPQLRRSKRRTLPVELQEHLELERAVRLELTNTGFAIQRLSRLATRANWTGRRDSNSRVEFGRLACFQLHHSRKKI